MILGGDSTSVRPIRYLQVPVMYGKLLVEGGVMHGCSLVRVRAHGRCC